MKQENWTTVGAEYVERLGREDVEREIAALDWKAIPENGSLSVGFLPGEAIKTAIRDLQLPKVSAIAISGFERPSSSPLEDGWYPGFYGVEANYKNGRARVYLLDLGATLTPLRSDFWPVESEVAA